MSAKNKKKLNKSMLIAVIMSAVAGLTALSLIITNLFIPVKYLFSYIVIKQDVPADGEMRVTFLDVGYGDCTFVEFPDGKTLLIDGGDGSYPNMLELFRFLNGRATDKIDYLVCTSVTKERCGGLAEILDYRQVGEVFSPYCLATNLNSSYREFSRALKGSGLKNSICEYGAGVFGEDYFFCFLSPSPHTAAGGEYELINAAPTTENIMNATANIYLEYKNNGFLILGDGTSGSFLKLVDQYRNLGGFEANGKIVKLDNCKIVKIANHGAEKSVCSPLYDLIKPQTAILSVSSDNASLPCLQAIADAQRYCSDNLYRTDRDGTVTVTTDGFDYVFHKEK